MKRTLPAVLTTLAASLGLWLGAGTAHGAVVATDDFNRPALGPDWTLHGGDELYIQNNEMSAVGTLSEPVSWALHTTPSPTDDQRVSAVIRWNGRSPVHSAMSVALRADPASQHAGVHFWFTARYFGIAKLEWDGTSFVQATGTQPYHWLWWKWAEGTKITLTAQGNTYRAFLNNSSTPILTGTFTDAQVPRTNRYGGIHGQDDSLVPNGGQPPANLDTFEFASLP